MGLGTWGALGGVRTEVAYPRVHRASSQSLSRTQLPPPLQIRQSGQQWCRHLGGQCSSGPGRASPGVGKTGSVATGVPGPPSLSWLSLSCSFIGLQQLVTGVPRSKPVPSSKSPFTATTHRSSWAPQVYPCPPWLLPT